MFHLHHHYCVKQKSRTLQVKYKFRCQDITTNNKQSFIQDYFLGEEKEFRKEGRATHCLTTPSFAESTPI